MNLLNYPKQYYATYFCGKNPKKFKFNESIIEFLGVLIFIGILQALALIAIDQLDFEMIITQIVLMFLIFGAAAGAIRLTFMFFKGKSTFQKDAAVIYKYACGMAFLSGIVSIVFSLLPLESFDFIVLSILGMLISLFAVYLFLAIWPSVVADISKIEKVGLPKANLIFAFGIALFIIVLFVLLTFFFSPLLQQADIGQIPI